MSGERMQVRAERAPFVMLPRWLLYHAGVGEGAKFLYCVLHDLVNGREGPTRPVTRAKLAELCRVSPNTIDRRLAELIAAGAVDKEPQILAGGQVANVYQVWLTPPEQRSDRVPTVGEACSERITRDGDPVGNSHVPVDNRLPTDGEAGPERILNDGDPPHRWGPPLPMDGDPAVLEEGVEEEIPPQPPRTAGGPGDASRNGNDLLDGIYAVLDQQHGGGNLNGNGHTRPAGGRRADGTNLRALRANPRAEDQLAAAERERERAARLEAGLEAKTAARVAAERAGEAERVAFEAEALAVSAALDDDRLAAIVEAVRSAMAGPLARSGLAVTRAVVDWCRAAAASRPDPSSLAATVDAALDAGRRLPLAGGPPLPLTLDAPAAGTVPLRRRVAALLVDAAVGVS